MDSSTLSQPIRKWKHQYDTQIRLTVSDVFSGESMPQAELGVVHASKDPNLEWRVRLSFAYQPEANSWRMDVGIRAFSRADPKTLVTVTAKGRLSVGLRQCSYSGCRRALPEGQTYCSSCGYTTSLEDGVLKSAEIPLSEGCCFRLDSINITRNYLLQCSTSNSSSFPQVYCLPLTLELSHFADEEMTVFQSGHAKNLSTHLSELLESGRMSDVTFRVGGEDVKAHSQVLGAASEVFAAMFTLDTKDRRTGRVDVPDASAACFREMLRCVYTDSVPAWDGAGDGGRSAEEAEELLLGLLFLSEKYALAALGKHCQGRLLSTLTLANVVERLKVVDVVCPALVPAITFPFVRSQLAEVLAQEAWADLMRDDVKLAAKVMHSAMQRYDGASELLPPH